MNGRRIDLLADLLVLVLGSALGIAFALLARSAVLVDGSYLPFGVDAFYHARRILDAIAGHGIREFDALMHVPEGGWVPWPWGFDWLLATITRTALWLSPGRDPMSALVYIPVAWIVINAGLLLGVLRALAVRPELRGLAVMGFALSPLVQRLHGIGVIDHHFMELTFVLLSALLLLRWLSRPHSLVRAAACGVALGLAQVFHHGLFILQLPVLVTVLILWWRGSAPPARGLRVMAATVLLTTLIVILPSDAFRDGQFTMATFSWFHLYVTFGTAAALAFMSSFSCALRPLLALLTGALVLLVPAASEALLGARFVSGRLDMPGPILEMASPFSMVLGHWGLAPTLGRYSGLLLLVPLMLVAAAYTAATDRRPVRVAFSVLSIFGLALLMLQYRLNYFGLAFLLAVPVVLLSELSRRYEARRAPVFLGALILFALAYRPPLSGPLFQRQPVAGDHLYEASRPLYPALRRACEEAPGVVAASAQFGHYIRFHTGCSVIANNFLLTEQHFDKVREANSLFHLSVGRLRAQAPYVRYVLAFLSNVYEQRGDKVYLRDTGDIRQSNPPLIDELMLTEKARESAQALQEIFLDPDANPKLPLAGIYRIRH